MRLITASQLERVEKCPVSQSLPAAWSPSSDASERGTAIHGFIENLHLGHEQSLAAVPEKYREECAAIDVRQIPRAAMSSEEVFAFHIFPEAKRRVQRLKKATGREERYAGATDLNDVITGTADLIGLGENNVTVLDIKTGHGYLPNPSQSLQLLFFAVAGARYYKRSQAVAGWIILRDSTPVIVTEELDALALAEAEDRLALILAKAVDASTKPEKQSVTMGEHCKYCPALRRCPAYQRRIDVDAALNTERGLLAVEALERQSDLMRESLKMIASQEPIKCADGRVYGPRQMSRVNRETGEVTTFERFERYRP